MLEMPQICKKYKMVNYLKYQLNLNSGALLTIFGLLAILFSFTVFIHSQITTNND